jgi:hypothetical protein
VGTSQWHSEGLRCFMSMRIGKQDHERRSYTMGPADTVMTEQDGQAGMTLPTHTGMDPTKIWKQPDKPQMLCPMSQTAGSAAA